MRKPKRSDVLKGTEGIRGRAAPGVRSDSHPFPQLELGGNNSVKRGTPRVLCVTLSTLNFKLRKILLNW